MFFFFKQVRISPEIDWYHYQGASAAPTRIVRHQTNDTPFLRSVTSEPTVGGVYQFLADSIWTPPKMQVLSVHPPQIGFAREIFERKIL